ncbi:hypothetical protein H4R35_007610, partial [Dimargaris xerosporica]
MRALETEIWLLEEHLSRLERSAHEFATLYQQRYFAATPPRAALLRTVQKHCAQTLAAESSARSAVPTFAGWKWPVQVRLLMNANGTLTIETTAIHTIPSSAPLKVALSNRPVSSNDLFLRHKTTHRSAYTAAWQAHGLPKPDYFDVILVNEREEITEGCISNIAIEYHDASGQPYWKTPSLDS